LKVEERDIVQAAIQEKKQSIKQIGEELNFVQKISDYFRILADIYKEQKYFLSHYILFQTVINKIYIIFF